MKTLSTKITVLLVVILFTKVGIAQNQVNANGTSFNSNLEVVKAQISKEKLSLVLYEVDKSDPKYQTDNCTDCPDGKSLILDVDFKRGFKFPIEETDSVYVRVSNLQESLAEYKFASQEIDEYESSRDRAEEAQLKSNAEVIKAKSMAISKQLQEGKITPDEAQKQLMALMEPQFEALENSAAMKNLENIDEYQERSTYSINFYNNETLTDTETFSGYLYIKTFNETTFIAEYRGELIEECVEKRAASSIEAEQKCKSTLSQYLPDAEVLSEGPGAILINVKIKTFLNNR
ncbi:hypothetical protein [Winogradskyella sp.]|uniref:hypothetical protein n=1 Tax=Winogradskyella sp. TaxID=1883156 RepID=UPI0026017696|nr:hypothetical protein [Winogradskyella sp.]